MGALTVTESRRIRHRAYTISGVHNLDELPEEKAVYGIFALVREEPANCRHVGETENLRETIRELYETPDTEGMRKFMQGPWAQFIQYQCMPGSSQDQREMVSAEWRQTHTPAVDEEGNYPGYYV